MRFRALVAAAAGLVLSSCSGTAKETGKSVRTSCPGLVSIAQSVKESRASNRPFSFDIDFTQTDGSRTVTNSDFVDSKTWVTRSMSEAVNAEDIGTSVTTFWTAKIGSVLFSSATDAGSSPVLWDAVDVGNARASTLPDLSPMEEIVDVCATLGATESKDGLVTLKVPLATVGIVGSRFSYSVDSNRTGKAQAVIESLRPCVIARSKQCTVSPAS
jgi:hypothetical protein